ncbi:MAG: KH domain-containing protein [Candidatus Tectomicrobia bacterium]|nr:KH domain-containing protein [Candidatus Tectomicrobia bacterium]
MRDLIEYIARQLADHPEQVRVDAVERGQETVLELRVAPEDLGRVIGREGRTAKAMRALLSAVSAHVGKRTVLEILD